MEMDREAKRLYLLHQENVVDDLQATCRILGPIAGAMLLRQITRTILAFRQAALHAAQKIVEDNGVVVPVSSEPVCEK